MSKKYYWLKLDRNFFKRHDIRIIESMENGKDYLLFYLKLLVESIDHEGKLRFNELIPYNDTMLSTITNTNIDVVRSAINMFQQLGMVEMWDDQTIYITDTKSMLGEGKSTERVRRFREKQKMLSLENQGNVTETLHETEIEKEIEIEIDKDNIDIDKSISLYNEVAHLFSSICKSYPKLTKLSEKRKKAIKARLNSGYTVDDFKTVFEKAESSNFLKGKNKKNWSATFDWLICDSNMAKVLDGNYDNKKPVSDGKEKKPSYDLEESFRTSWQLVHGGDNDD